MLNKSQLAHMRERQALSLMDICHKLTYSRTINSHREPVATYTEDETDVPCGLEQKQGTEVGADKTAVVTYDAILRLSLKVTIDEKDRVRIVKRYGERITPIDYEIVSPQQRGPSGIRLLLKKVTI